MLDTLHKVSTVYFIPFTLPQHNWNRNLEILATHLDNPDDVKYLWSFENMQTDAEIEEFWAWCQNHTIKAV